ncbi:hypothetical protein [Tautonia plasticadhaerens]|uniref:Uncharacterized protein n=1 Tax=Tautonia plasticadhaerens TaxID=2527974 RepID=A0A518GUU4_9BACT|nr:hypothetical protein [Tautonia plasticadhaerens]QDV32354.1 hypothetical protein ElP_01820 [Tautonia plasticadhaerens]
MSRSRTPDPEAIRALLEALRAGSFPGPACRAAGISRSTLRRWLGRGRSKDDHDAPYRAFRRDYRAAIASAEVGALDSICRAGSEGIPGSWQASAWLLERRFPARWRRKDQAPDPSPPKPLSQMTDAELDAYCGRLGLLDEPRR